MCKCIIPRAYEQQIQRQWWMRLIPFSALYFCTHCEAKTLRMRRVARMVSGAHQ